MRNGRKVFVNPDFIETISNADEGDEKLTGIFFHGDDDFFYVKETIDQIMEAIPLSIAVQREKVDYHWMKVTNERSAIERGTPY